MKNLIKNLITYEMKEKGRASFITFARMYEMVLRSEKKN